MAFQSRTPRTRAVSSNQVPSSSMISGKMEKADHPSTALRRLLAYFLPYHLTLLLVLLCMLLYTVLGLMGPYLMGVAIDGAMAGKDSAALLRTALQMMLAFISCNIFQYLANLLMARVSQQALQQLRSDLFERLQQLSLRFFDRNPAGELMSRLINDIDAINQAVSQNVTNLLTSVLSMAGILITMFILNAYLALATLLVVPLVAWFANFVARYTRRGYRRLQKSLGEMNALAEETISGQKVIRSFRRNDAVIAAFRRQNQEVFEAGLYANSYALLLMPITGVLGNFFVIVLAGLGGWLALHELVSVGVIATFISYGQSFIRPLRQLANLYNAIQAALAGAERVFDVIDNPVEIEECGAALELALEQVSGCVCFDEVTFGYEREVPVIRNMTLHAAAGETIALVGPTGAGKTTIINLLTRFYDVDEGSITLDGVDIRRLRKEDVRRKLGLVLQDTFLFSSTVMENIRYGRLDATDEECMRAAELADADHFIRLLPQGYATLLSERAANLSQGQRQLLAIARVILADAPILILDEATSSVDTRTELRIQQSLLRLMEGRTSFVIAHRLSTIRGADRVVVIDDGRIVEQGSHAQLLEKKGFYHHLYTSQFRGQTI